MENGLLDLEGLLAGRDNVLHPHSPEWFSLVALPYAFDPAAECPKRLAFLERNLEGDRERIAFMQEWYGYTLTHDTSQQKFVFHEGDGANGKSVACAVQTALLGWRTCRASPGNSAAAFSADAVASRTSCRKLVAGSGGRGVPEGHVRRSNDVRPEDEASN
jgi:phage/plasmid-associated DNA primase